MRRLKETLVELLDLNKAENITVTQLPERVALADAMIVAHAASKRHVAAIGQNLSKALKKAGISHKLEGMNNAEWVLVDAGSIIVHIFKQEVRDHFALEKMWGSDSFGEASSTGTLS